MKPQIVVKMASGFAEFRSATRHILPIAAAVVGIDSVEHFPPANIIPVAQFREKTINVAVPLDLGLQPWQLVFPPPDTTG